MKCVSSIEKHGAFFLLAFLFLFFYTSCTTFSRVGAGYLLYACHLQIFRALPFARLTRTSVKTSFL